MKHAFLIVAHHQFDILGKMISLLDDDDCDFYINIDGKTKENPEGYLSSCASKSRVYFSHLNVYWGGYSLIACPLHLLKMATPFNYSYYHYMSGVDFPIKTKKQILDFFSSTKPQQFVHFERAKVQDKYVDRLRYHTLFQDTNSLLLHWVDRIIRQTERVLRVDRVKNSQYTFQFGSNWFSITHDFAVWIVQKEKVIEQIFCKTTCGDELFIQTMLVNSPYRNEINQYAFNNDCRASLRLVDWKRGKPYVFRTGDFDELISSPCLFARKFDLNVDPEIIESLFNYLKE